LDDVVVYLVPVGPERFELYTEQRDDAVIDGPPPSAPGFWQQWRHRLHERWREAVRASRHAEPAGGRLARVRDWAVRGIAETIAEQRTLWSLRVCTGAALVHPSDLTEETAAAARDRLLTHAARHHGRWLMVDAVLLAVSGVFVIVPGPNVLAYYFAFRVVAHYLSWRGARQALARTVWRLSPEPALADLGRLAGLPRDARASRVDAIAAALNLPRLAAFFDRTTVPVP
jgi:hypothetical protein